MFVKRIDNPDLDLIFIPRAEFYELIDICKKYNMNYSDIGRCANSYVKSYISALVDNYEYVIRYHNKYSYVNMNDQANSLYNDALDLKKKVIIEIKNDLL